MEAATINNGIALLANQVHPDDSKALWVFAYGSLCWKPGFKFNKAVTGHVRGYHRRFWQGNTTHRGTEDKPGRVATLVKDSKGVVYGVAFAISGETAIPYLSKRECDLGGYITHFTDFYPLNGNETFKVLVYIATPKNPHWLGDAHIIDIANQIVDCKGTSGHNVEYIIRLADFMRNHFPDYYDDHLYNLENEVLNLIELKKICLTKIMGNGDGCVKFIKNYEQSNNNNNNNNNQQQQNGDIERIESFQHTARVPDKKLRCLNL